MTSGLSVSCNSNFSELTECLTPISYKAWHSRAPWPLSDTGWCVQRASASPVGAHSRTRAALPSSDVQTATEWGPDIESRQASSWPTGTADHWWRALRALCRSLTLHTQAARVPAGVVGRTQQRRGEHSERSWDRTSKQGGKHNDSLVRRWRERLWWHHQKAEGINCPATQPQSENTFLQRKRKMKTSPDKQKVRECVANRCSQSPNWVGDGMGWGGSCQGAEKGLQTETRK